MAEKDRKPRIRFKGFADAWEQRKLGEIANAVTRNEPTSDAPIMMITANNGFIEQSERYAFNNAGESLKKYILLEKGELAYNHGASKMRPYGSCFALTTVEKARIPFVYHCFSVGQHDSEFVSIELNGAEVEKQLRRIVSSGARMDGLLNISFEEYTSIEVLLPVFEEQDKIATCFRTLDNLITLHQRKYDKLVDVKKSMLEKMFPQGDEKVPKIRFKGFSDAWEQRKLDELSEKTYGGGTPSTQNERFWNGVIPWIQSSDIEEGRLYGVSPRKFISQEGLNQSAAQLIPKNSIAIITRVGVGKLAFMPFSYATSQDFVSLSRLTVDPFFTVYACYRRLQTDLNSVQGTSIKGITKEELLSKVILVPDEPEQRLIGGLFRRLDDLITLHQRKLEKLKNIKSALLEKMFV